MNFRKLTEKEVYALPRNQFVYLTDMYHLTLDGNVPPKLVHPNRTPVSRGEPGPVGGRPGAVFHADPHVRGHFDRQRHHQGRRRNDVCDQLCRENLPG